MKLRTRPGQWRSQAAAVALLLAGIFHSSPGDASAQGLTPPEERGRQIYRTGASPSGSQITAVLSAGAVEVPADAMPCGGCHGRDGRGGREGGVSPPDLRWHVLTRPYGATRPGGRTHPPYDERLLKRAVTLGLDPAGNELHAAMPRYRMSLADMADLLAYLKRLGSEPVPGVGESTLRVGTLLPEGPAGASVRALLGAYLEEVNRRGGVYGRRIELLAETPHGSPEERRAQVAAWLDREPVFALVGTHLAGADAELPALFAERELPVVGAVSPPPAGIIGSPPSGPPDSLPPGPTGSSPTGSTGSPVPGGTGSSTFYLLPGLTELGLAAVELAVQDGKPAGALAVVAGEEPHLTAVAAAAEAAARSRGWPVATSLRLDPGGLPAGLAAALVRELRDAGAGTVFFAAPGPDLARFLVAAAELGWQPRILAPGPLAGAEALAAPPSFDRRILLAFPTLPSDQTPAARVELARLASGAGSASAGSTPRATPAQVAALAAAKLLVEALNRAGRELTREALVERLESLQRFDTGLLPPLTYKPGRRIGALGAYGVVVDLKQRTFLPASGWIPLPAAVGNPAEP